MGLINSVDDLRPLMDGAKALQTMDAGLAPDAPAAEGDFLGKLERVISGINSLLENAAKLRGEAQPLVDNRFSRPLMASPSPSHPTPAPIAPPKAQDAPKGDDKISTITAEIIKNLENYIGECVKADPNMPVGQAIMQFPMNVTQAQVLLQLAKTIKNQ